MECWLCVTLGCSMFSARCLATAAVLAVLSVLPARAAVVNGNFEDTSVTTKGLVNKNTLANLAGGPGASWDVYKAIAGWTTTGGSGIEVQSNRTLGTIDSHGGGSLYVELDSHPGPKSNSSMQQTLMLGRGTYQLDFWYSPRTNDAKTNGISYSVLDKALKVLLEGSVTGPAGDIKVGVWTKVSGLFTVAKGTSPVTLNFAAIGKQDTYGGLLDDVSVTQVPAPVPVPATLPMLMAALAGLGLAARRRRA